MITSHLTITLIIFAFGVFPQAVNAVEHSLEKLVDVGGHRLHIHCMGVGTPAIILDAGLGKTSRDWSQVQVNLAKTTRVCIYDRAGYGQSDPGPPPRTSSRLVSELRTLLARTAISPPYILAGHSFGGLNMRLFASFYPQDTAGLVLVDPPHEGQLDAFWQSEVMGRIDPQGVLRRLWQPELALSSSTWEPLATLLRLDIRLLRAIAGELAGFRESADELSTARLRPDLPLVVIMHGRRVLPAGRLGDQMEQQWLELQRKLISNHQYGRLILAEESAHNIPLHQPELIIEALRELVEAKRREAQQVVLDGLK